MRLHSKYKGPNGVKIRFSDGAVLKTGYIKKQFSKQHFLVTTDGEDSYKVHITSDEDTAKIVGGKTIVSDLSPYAGVGTIVGADADGKAMFVSSIQTEANVFGRGWVAWGLSTASAFAIAVLTATQALPAEIDAPPAILPMRIATTNQRTADLARTLTATNDRVQQRTLHLLGGPVTEIRLGVTPRYMTLGGEGSVANFMIDALALEVDGVGTFPVTFDGVRTKEVASTEIVIWSDPVAIPAPVMAALGRSSRLWVRAQFTASNLRLPVCTAYLIGSSPSWAGNASYLYPSTTTQSGAVIGQIDATGDLLLPDGNQTSGVNNNMRLSQTSNTGHTVPVYITARFAVPGVRSVLAIGDSNSQGVGDPDVTPSYASNGTIGGRGLLSRVSIVSDTDPQAIPMLNTGLSAMLGSSWVVNDFRKEMMKYADVVIEAMGNNDVSQGADASMVMARRRLIWADSSAAGCKTIALYIPPRSVSASNNTPFNLVGWGPGGAAQLHNAELINELSAGRVNAILNIRQYISDPADDTIWRTPASTYTRSDGAHLKSGSTTLIAPPLRALVLSV